jgi:hypothetical protein
MGFSRYDFGDIGVVRSSLRLRDTSAEHLDDLATPNKAFCRKTRREKVYDIFFLIMVSPAMGGIEPF